jgi:hypothetical protein
MIDVIDLATINTMASQSVGPWVSIYLPTERIGPNAASKLRLKNHLATASTLLTERGVAKSVIAEIDLQGQSVLADNELWAKRENGLAVFVASEASFAYRATEAWLDSVTVADTPDIDQLQAEASKDRPFAVLALSLDHVRLFFGDQRSLVEDDRSMLPPSMAHVLFNNDREPQLQTHSSGRVGSGATVASFHGQELNELADIDRFLRAVDRGLSDAVDKDLPVVLAGVDRLVTEFRHVSEHGALVEAHISGNCDHKHTAELHSQAWTIVETI